MLDLQVLFHEVHDSVSVLDCVVIGGCSPDGSTPRPGEPFTLALRHETAEDGVRLTAHLARWTHIGAVINVTAYERAGVTLLTLTSADDELVLEITPEPDRH